MLGDRFDAWLAKHPRTSGALDKLADKLGLVQIDESEWLTWSIGETARMAQVYSMLGRLRWRRPGRGVVYAGRKQGRPECNRVLINELKRNPDLLIVRSKLLRVALQMLLRNRRYNFRSVEIPGHGPLDAGNAHIAVSKAYAAMGGHPTFQMSPRMIAKGQAVLRRMGIKENDWFVCLHARDEGYHSQLKERLRRGNRGHRNSDIESYLDAARWIEEQGGWVIRMGHPNSPPIEARGRIIDYAHSRHRSPLMDVFLATQCRMFIGTNSGLFVLASSAGVPCALANHLPHNEAAICSTDLYLPKLYQEMATNRILSLQECLDPEVLALEWADDLRDAGIRVVDNSAEEIRRLVAHQFRVVTGAVPPSEPTELQRQYLQIKHQQGYAQTAHVEASFLEQYPELVANRSLT